MTLRFASLLLTEIAGAGTTPTDIGVMA